LISTVLEGAAIVDGSGRPGYTTDLAIVDDRIALIGDMRDRDAAQRLDCRGLTVTPGFVDACSHSDETWLAQPAVRSKTSQGVTTEIAGMCGRSAAPSGKQECASVDLFLHALRGSIGPNVALFTGLSDLAPGSAEATVREAREQGALGVSLRLESGSVEIAGVQRIAVHLPPEPAASLELLEAAIALAERAEAALHVSHHRIAARGARSAMHRSLEIMSRARTRGLSLSCDVFPYVATSIELRALLPPGVEPKDLEDPQFAAAAAVFLQTLYGERWDEFVLAEVRSEALMDWCGRRIEELARAWRLSPARAVLRVVEREPSAKAFVFNLDEEDIAVALSAGFTAIGSDASGLPIDAQAFFGQPHPRAFGTFPRIFGRFVRQRKTLSLEEAVRRMTSLPASIFGLEDRGEIREGAFADLAVFDAGRIRDTATYESAVSLPVGIEHVLVNGVRVIERGNETGARPGRALHGGRG
jgi:N-acyl-D-amino-acid deacylase